MKQNGSTNTSDVPGPGRSFIKTIYKEVCYDSNRNTERIYREQTVCKNP